MLAGAGAMGPRLDEWCGLFGKTTVTVASPEAPICSPGNRSLRAGQNGCADELLSREFDFMLLLYGRPNGLA